jgi:hypothetical protein
MARFGAKRESCEVLLLPGKLIATPFLLDTIVGKDELYTHSSAVKTCNGLISTIDHRSSRLKQRLLLLTMFHVLKGI